MNFFDSMEGIKLGNLSVSSILSAVVVFIICLIIVGRRLLLIAQRKKSEKTRPSANAFLFFFCSISFYELFQRTPIWSPIISCTCFTISWSIGASALRMLRRTFSGFAELKRVVVIAGLLTANWIASFSMG